MNTPYGVVPLIAVDLAFKSVDEHKSGITWAQMQTALNVAAPVILQNGASRELTVAKGHIDTLRRLAGNDKDTDLAERMKLVIDDLANSLGIPK